MKRTISLFVAAIALFAFAAGAQTVLPDGYDAQGPPLIVTALDTLWYSTTQPTGAEAIQWVGPATFYKQKSNGSFFEMDLQPLAIGLYATGPFRYNAYWKNGETTTLATVLVDTVNAVGGGNDAYGKLYACHTMITGLIDSLRVHPAGSDTLYAVPYYKWPE